MAIVVGQKSSHPSQERPLDYDAESPPYSPTPSAMERPSLSPQVTHDLRQACAILVALTNPPDPDDDLDPQEFYRRREAERKARYVARMQKAEAKSMKADLWQVKQEDAKSKIEPAKLLKKEQPQRYSTRRPQRDSQDATQSQATHYVPKDPMGRHRASDVHKKMTQATATTVTTTIPEPVLPPVHAPIVERTRELQKRFLRQQQIESQALGHIRKSLHARPKTSAAACIDYDEPEPATFSSKSTSRSTSGYAAIQGRPTSTGLTSLQALTPSMTDGRTSQKGRRPSEVESASESMKEIQELARQRANEYVANKERINSSRPPSRRSKLSRMTSCDSLETNNIRQGRSSRAGSFASSIADGISNYIRPSRLNSAVTTDGQNSLRSGRSSSLGFSSRSRSSSMSRRSSFSNAGWWRNGGLRRRGSWASFRSGGGESGGRERNKLRKDGGPNLNRPLPALPGLDQYKEVKTHIGQLVKSGGKKKKVKKNKIGEPQPVIPYDTPYISTLPHSRSGSKMGFYPPEQMAGVVQSAPLPMNDDGVEKQFPRPESNQANRSGSQQQQREREIPIVEQRRSTHPVTAHSHSLSQQQQATALPSLQSSPKKASAVKFEKAQCVKLHRSSLNPIKPRRLSNTSNTNDQERKLPPPMIRGPSYTKELEEGVYPRPMAVNDGGQNRRFYNEPGKEDGGDWVKRKGAEKEKERGGSGQSGSSAAGLKGKMKLGKGKQLKGKEARKVVAAT